MLDNPSLEEVHMLPPELHHPILEFILRAGDHDTLFACGLTSRKWLDTVAGVLFRVAFLKSTTELEGLMKCLKQPYSFLQTHVRELQLTQHQSEEPWGQNVLIGLGIKLPLLEKMTFRSQGNTVVGLVKPPFLTFSAHPTMPKRLPSLLSHFQDLRELYLSNYHFQSVYDIIRLPGVVPGLVELTCEKLWWNREPDTPPRLRCTGHNLLRVHVRDCKTIWPFIWLWTSPKSQLAPRNVDVFPGINHHDAAVASGIVRSCKSHALTTHADFECRMTNERNKWILKSSDLHFEQSIQFHLVVGPSQTGSISKVILEDPSSILHHTVPDDSEDVYDAFQWQQIDDLLSQLPALEAIVVDAVNTDSDTIDDPTILDEIRVLMPHVGDTLCIKDEAADEAWKHTIRA